MTGAYAATEGPDESETVRALRAARRDTGKVVLEGAHALKHALRFGATIDLIATPDPAALDALLDEIAPDVAPEVRARRTVLTPAAWQRAVDRALPSPALSVARRPELSAADVLATEGVVVLLEDPRHLGNLGAVVRVAAAAGAGGVLVLGEADPWHPVAVRGAAGLQFALPVARTDHLPASKRPVVALDATGEVHRALPPDALLAVGTERHGLSPALLGQAGIRVAIPMREGVSSLNLATAVAIALYAG